MCNAIILKKDSLWSLVRPDNKHNKIAELTW